MKQKLLLSSVLFIICISTASAQINKGAFYIGGNLSYNYDSFGSTNTYSYPTGYTNYYVTKVSNFSISPEFGYFLSKKWSISIQPTYQRTSGTGTSDFYSYSTPADNFVYVSNYQNNIIGIGINARYYCMLSDKIGFFPQIGLGTLNNVTYLKYGTLNLGVNPNFVFFATPQLGINLGFGTVNYSLDYKTKDHTINAGLNNNITFGLNYYWGRK